MSGQTTKASATVSVNGQVINCEKMDICLTKTKKSEIFHATIAMYDPAAQGIDAAAGSSVTCSINGAQIGGSFILEDPDFCFDRTEIMLTGRDEASSQLIDTQNTQTFTNQQPNDVVQTLAQGVQTSMDTVGSLAGKLYQTDWNAITHRGSAWSAIQKLADIFGMNAYITGGTLYWKSIDEQLPAYNLTWSPPSQSSYAIGNVIRLRGRRHSPMSKQISVTARSHNYKQKQSLSATAQAGGSVSGERKYNYVVASAQQDQLQAFATKKAHEHAKHAFNIEAEIPGDTSITARMSLQLSGTGTNFDTNYDVQDVRHEVSFDGGYLTIISGKDAAGGGGSRSAAGGAGQGSSSASGAQDAGTPNLT